MLGVALVVLVGTAAWVALAARDGYESEFVWSEQKWILDAISRDQRNLMLVFPSGGCTYDKGRAHLEESRDAVRIRVEARDPRVSRPCTSDLRAGKATVRLRAPLSGRRVLGAQRIGFMEPLGVRSVRRGEYYIRLVPRVAGLAVADARRLLDAHGFRVPEHNRSGARDVAVGTRPALGTPVPRGTVQVLSR
jgi:hypothetical protein